MSSPTAFQIFCATKGAADQRQLAKRTRHPFIALFLETCAEPLRHFSNFIACVDVSTIASPTIVVVLYVAARLFPASWQQLLPCVGDRRRHGVAKKEQIVSAVESFNSKHGACSAEELLEMTQLARKFVRPATLGQTNATEKILIGKQYTLAVFGKEKSENDNYRLALLLVLWRAAADPSLSANFAEMLFLVRRLGGTTYRAVANLSAAFESATPITSPSFIFEQFNSPNEVIAIVRTAASSQQQDFSTKKGE